MYIYNINIWKINKITMKKVVDMKIKTDNSIDAKKFVSKLKEIVEELNNEEDNEFDQEELFKSDNIEEIVKNMYEKDYSLKEVMEITNLSAEEIAAIIEDYD